MLKRFLLEDGVFLVSVWARNKEEAFYKLKLGKGLTRIMRLKKEENMQPKIEIALSIYWAVFGEVKRLQIDNIVLEPDNRIKKLRNLKSPNYLYIEQNPEKSSMWAKMARDGRKILWVIRLKDNKYVMRIIDGVTYPLEKEGKP